MRSRAPVLYAFALAAIGHALMAAPHRRHPRPGQKHLPTLELASAKPLSLSEAREAEKGSSPAAAGISGGPYFGISLESLEKTVFPFASCRGLKYR